MQVDRMEQLVQALKAMPKEEQDRVALHLLGVLSGMEIADTLNGAKKPA